MAKFGSVLPDDKKEIAIANGIPLTTVYRRLKRDWDMERAITQPPRKSHIHKLQRRKEGAFKSDRLKSKEMHAFFNYAENEKAFMNMVNESGKNVSNFIADLIDKEVKANG